MHRPAGYELIDFGGGARLERFGARTVDRPYPAALDARQHPDAWAAADLRFDRERGWTGDVPADDDPWQVAIEGLALELRTTGAGQVGLFPEHLAMVPWLRAAVAHRTIETRSTADEPASADHERPTVLHLFAYTGLTTLAMAAAGAEVVHVDSARPAIAWARRNASLSGLDAAPVRWIADDALSFAKREVRRGRRYDGVVLDPPTYGHGPTGRPWQLAEHLPELLDACMALIGPKGFMLLTAHTTGLDAGDLAAMLTATRPGASAVGRGALVVATSGGRRLELGAFARWPAGAS